MAQFYRDDYLVLDGLTFGFRGPRGDSCRAGLQSIIARRGNFAGMMDEGGSAGRSSGLGTRKPGELPNCGALPGQSAKTAA